VAQHLDVSHVMKGHSHRSILRPRGNRPRRLTRLDKGPVVQKFSLVGLSPLEHLAHHVGRQGPGQEHRLLPGGAVAARANECS
jgi:hypothetical protein